MKMPVWGEHLADRAVGADRQEPLARTFHAIADGKFAGRMTHIGDLAAMPRRRVAQCRNIGQAVVQPARQIHAEFERPYQQALPALAENAAAIGRADDDGLDPGGGRFLDRHVGQAEIGVAARQPELAARDVRPPEGNARGGLGGELVGGVADEQQIRSAQGHRPHPFRGGFAKPAILRNC